MAVGIDGLDQVMVEAGLAGEPARLVLGVARDGDEQGVAQLGSAGEAAAPPRSRSSPAGRYP